MINEQAKIALIEFFPYHTECLYSQLLFLRDCKHVTLICDKKVEKIVANFSDVCEKICYYDFSKIKSLLQVQLFLAKNRFDIAILNTAQGSRPLKFALLPHRRSMKLVGTVHDTGKITSSLGQQIICKRLSGFYVLAHYIDEQIPTEWSYRHQYFLPIYYPKYEIEPLQKQNDIWVCIPGAIEYKRRDYMALIDIAQNPNLDKRVKFILLGNQNLGEGNDFIAKIKENNLQERFITFAQRVPDPLFYSYIQQSDYLLTLIHPTVESFEAYKTSKISGMFPLAMAYNKPLLCYQDFAKIKDFDFKAQYYATYDELVAVLNATTAQESNYSIDFEDNKRHYLQLL